MKLSLSVRIAEAATKDRLTVSFDELARLALRHGYHAVCMRPSVVGAKTPEAERAAVRRTLDGLGLAVSMATTDIAVPLNNEHGPDSLREFGPHLDAAQSLGATLIRVCMKHDDDVPWVQRAADAALQRGVRIAHQCHTDSLFETVAGSLDVIKRIGRRNVGVIYEPANLMLCGEENGPTAIKQLAPHIMNVYVQNHRLSSTGRECLTTRVKGEVRYDPVPLWAPGGVDFRAVFDGLASIGYDGYVTVHQAFAEMMDATEAAERSAQFLRSIAKFDPPISVDV